MLCDFSKITQHFHYTQLEVECRAGVSVQVWQMGAKDVYLVLAWYLEEPCGLDVGCMDR